MENINIVELKGIYLVTVSIFTFFLGAYLLKKLSFLQKYNIPEGIIGGIPICICFFVLKKTMGIKISFDLQLRDFFLLFFFCTVGMLANIKELLKGGTKLIKLIGIILLFLILQNSIGLIVAKLSGSELINGLIAGTITLAGGHGTAISWGKHLESLGYVGSMELGIIAATIGLISGGIVGGPVATSLIKKNNLLSLLKKKQNKIDADFNQSELIKIISSTNLFLRMLVFILFSIVIGIQINKLLIYLGCHVPEYLPVMFVGIIFINFIGFFSNKIKLNNKKLELLNNISLQIFITMSMLSIDIESLFNKKVLDIAIIILFQIFFIIFFAKNIFFKVAGKSYDAAVLTAGFIGSGLGAVPVGLANIETVTRRCGIASIEALILLPLLGSVFTDLINALLLKGFVSLIAFF